MELRIVLADDNPEYRFLLRQFIERGTTFEVVGEASDGEEAIRLADHLLPQAVVMDVMMPGMGGAEATRAIRQLHPDIHVVALTNSMDDSHAIEMTAAGVDGYFLKSEPVDKLLYQLESIAQVVRDSSSNPAA